MLNHPQVADHGRWTIGTLIGVPVTILLLLACIVAAVIFLVKMKSVRYDRSFYRWSAVISLGFFVAVLVISLISFWPLKAEYHQYRHVTGTVQKISSRLLSAGDKGGTNQKFVIVFRGSPQQFGVDDTRASLVRVGDTIHVNCIRSYDYGATAGYDCKWGGN